MCCDVIMRHVKLDQAAVALMVTQGIPYTRLPDLKDTGQLISSMHSVSAYYPTDSDQIYLGGSISATHICRSMQ
jgi:hypothetical protein